MSQATRWWWVRHAPVTVNEGRVYGQEDLPCDCGDTAKFRSLAARLPREAVWVTSHLRRTHQTAAAIVAAGLPGPARIPGPDVIVEHDLAEQHFGHWQGKSHSDLPALLGEAYHRFWLAPAHLAPEGGESFADLISRVKAAIGRLGEAHAGRDIIAVTHGGTIRAALAEALDLTPDTALAFSIQNCSLTVIEKYLADGHGHPWRVVCVNQMPG
jgi:alpha-ribazole phosphatase